MSNMTGDELGIEICSALGLDSRRVTNIVISAQALGEAKVEITRSVEGLFTERFVRVLERYALASREHPALGMASTRQLLEELLARSEPTTNIRFSMAFLNQSSRTLLEMLPNEVLDYRTVDG
jgi:hypothetical protein